MKFGQRHCTKVQGLLPDFGATLKIISKKSNIDRNQIKLSTHHKYKYIHVHVIKCNKNVPNHYWENLANNPVL